MTETFQPDYTNILKVLHNQRPAYLPLYEHHIDAPFIGKCTGEKLEIVSNRPDELEDYFRKTIRFWVLHGYDAFDYEAAICDIIPGHGAIMGGMARPIQTRADFERFPFNDIPHIFWETYTPRLQAIRKVLPVGMKAYGGYGLGSGNSIPDYMSIDGFTAMINATFEIRRREKNT